MRGLPLAVRLIQTISVIGLKAPRARDLLRLPGRYRPTARPQQQQAVAAGELMHSERLDGV
jgi:hypothetical protein